MLTLVKNFNLADFQTVDEKANKICEESRRQQIYKAIICWKTTSL